MAGPWAGDLVAQTAERLARWMVVGKAENSAEQTVVPTVELKAVALAEQKVA
jgi:hypothetical protein